MTEQPINNQESGAEVTLPVAEHQAAQEVSTEIKHETTLFAEPIFSVGNFTVTNSLITSWIVVVIIIVLSAMIRKNLATVPKGLQNYAEMILDGALNLADSVTGSRKKSMKFLPIVLPLFFFILISNWLGLLPGVGTVGMVERSHGENVFVPFLRGGTADLNTTLALAIMAIVLTHIFGVVMTSSWKHLNRFIGLNLLVEIPRKIIKEKDFTVLLVNPIKFFVGIIEIVGELAKVASLSFRLFGNVFAGEVLLGAMAAIFAFALPIPFMFLEVLVGVIQALIFSLLTLVFLTVMTTEHDHEESH
ncbi:MAG: FoF1 ATP synthase subunit a [Candidatus Buchananbacteria bacterium]